MGPGAVLNSAAMRHAFTRTALCFTLALAGGVAACQGCHAPTSAASVTAPRRRGGDAAQAHGAALRGEQRRRRARAVRVQQGSARRRRSPRGATSPARRRPRRPASSSAPGRCSSSIPTLDRRQRDAGPVEGRGHRRSPRRTCGLAAWAPGANDWAAGAESLGKLTAATGRDAARGQPRGRAAETRSVGRASAASRSASSA